jgi:hypothetical protein
MVASGCGGRRGFFLAVGGGKRMPAVGVRGASDRKEEERSQQGNIGEERGKWLGASVG